MNPLLSGKRHGKTLLSQALPKSTALPQIGHEEEHAEEADAERYEVGDRRKRVIEAVKCGRNGEGEHVEHLAIARIEAGHAHEIACDAAPDGVQEGKRRKAGNV